MCEREKEVYDIRHRHGSAISDIQFWLRQLDNRVKVLEDVIIALDDRVKELETEEAISFMKGI